MSEIVLQIDGAQVEAREGMSVLEAARGAGISIPTLCHLGGHPPNVSCMVCAVAVAGRGRLLAACAAPAEPETHRPSLAAV